MKWSLRDLFDAHLKENSVSATDLEFSFLVTETRCVCGYYGVEFQHQRVLFVQDLKDSLETTLDTFFAVTTIQCISCGAHISKTTRIWHMGSAILIQLK